MALRFGSPRCGKPPREVNCVSPYYGICYHTFFRENDMSLLTRGAIVDKPWGYELLWAHTGRYVGKILHINKGESLSFQYHRVKDETIRLLSGAMEMDVEADGQRTKLSLKPGDCLHIVPGMKHRMTAVDDCDVLEVSTPELDDVVRLEDRYGRADRKD